AKAYGGESSGKFINGVLGTVYRELGEPMKNDSSKNKEVDKKEKSKKTSDKKVEKDLNKEKNTKPKK
ncbi:MAG: hypothetical protein KAQ63_01505, partial [Candidatus Moranbacteria bacterium]|nr:hypothetical protein [Candidatus Moranbacteria bacterium]